MKITKRSSAKGDQRQHHNHNQRQLGSETTTTTPMPPPPQPTTTTSFSTTSSKLFHTIVASSVLTIGVLLLTTSWITLEVAGQSSCHLRELDLCAATMLVFTQAPNGLATSDNEINKQCVHLRDADTCLRNYTRRCMTPIQREMVTFVANSSFALLDEYCTKGSRLRQQYLKHSQCLNQLQKKQEHKSCMRDLQASLELLTANNIASSSSSSSNGKSKDKDKVKRVDSAAGADQVTAASESGNGKRLALACCTYRKFDACLGGQMEKRCGKETIQFVQSIARRLTSRFPETICRNYKPDGNECKALLPKVGGAAPTSSKVVSSKSNSIIARLLSAYSGL